MMYDRTKKNVDAAIHYCFCIEMGSAAEKEKEADKLLKKANKETVPSLLDFRFSADWEQAAPLYERAALIYRVS
jgi:hypothetical protein